MLYPHYTKHRRETEQHVFRKALICPFADIFRCKKPLSEASESGLSYYLQSSLSSSDESGEAGSVVVSHIGENLAVQRDVGFLEAVDETGLVDVVGFAGRGNTRDP